MKKRDFLSAAAVMTVAAAGSTNAQAAELGPVVAVVTATLKDYGAFMQAYEGFKDARMKIGITRTDVVRDSKDGNTIVVFVSFADLAAAGAWLADPGLKERMAKSGVMAPPTIVVGTMTYSGQ